MSWQVHIDRLTGTGYIKRALICGHDGVPWASSADFNSSNAELKALIKGFTDNASILAPGFFLENTRYVTLRADNRLITGQKDASSVVSVKTGQTVIIGIPEEGTQLRQAVMAVQQLADSLMGMGF